jgi:Zn-dependent peptidase ImmA (M78 family)
MQKMKAGRQALVRRGLHSFVLGFTDFQYACREAGIIYEFTKLISPLEKGMFLWSKDGRDRVILLSPSLEDLGWERDLVAFHELAHATSPYRFAELRIERGQDGIKFRYSADYHHAVRMEHQANTLAACCLIPTSLLQMSNKQIRHIFGYPEDLIDFRRRMARKKNH